MKSFGYLNKEGFKNLWSKRSMTFTSIGVLCACMVLLGCFLLMILNINNVLNNIEDQNTIQMYIETGTSNKRISEIEDEILATGNIKKIEFKSNVDALKEIQENAGEQYRAAYDSLEPDALPNSFIVTVKNISNNDSTIQKLKQIDNILQIKDNREFVSTLKHIRNIVSAIGITIVIILFIVSFFIVYNTIRVTMFNRRLEIQIMRCVGATKRFIRYPFMVEGIMIGIISTLLSLGIEFLLYFAIQKMIVRDLISFKDSFVLLLISFLVIGIIAGIIASAKSVSKYLKKEGSEAFDG